MNGTVIQVDEKQSAGEPVNVLIMAV